MTTPKVQTMKRGGSRFYIDPETKRKNPGVTSVLNMLPKPFLKYWAAKLVAEEAVENIASVVGIAMNDRAGAIDFLKRAPDRNTRAAADAGSDAHDLFEKIAKGEKPRYISPEMQPFVDHFEEFVDLCEPEFLFLEETVWDDDENYAGSFDALATLNGDGAGDLKGQTLFMDWKTTRSGVYAEVALQLSAYRRAKHILRPDGTRVPMPKTDGGAVLHVRPEGWALYPAQTETFELDGQDVDPFAYFRALREVFDWDAYISKNVLGEPVVGGGELTASGRIRLVKPKKQG